MNIQETGKLLTIIQTTYRNYFKEFDSELLKQQATIWAKIFENVTMEEAYTGLMAWIAKEKFPPSPAELLELVQKNKNPEFFIGAETAWERVSEAVKRFGWSNKEKAFETFSAPIKRAVDNVGGWQRICQTPLGNEWGLLRKNFMDVYEELSQAEQEKVLLPNTVLKRLAEMQDQKQLGDGQ
jgi:hypothetical protein